MADASSNTEFPDMAYITTPLVKVCGLASAVNVLKHVMSTLISIIVSLKCILLLLKSIYCWLHLYLKYRSVMFQQGGGGANKQRYYAGATTDPLLSWILQLYNSIPFQKTPLNIFTPDDTESPNFAVWLTDYYK